MNEISCGNKSIGVS